MKLLSKVSLHISQDNLVSKLHKNWEFKQSSLNSEEIAPPFPGFSFKCLDLYAIYLFTDFCKSNIVDALWISCIKTPSGCISSGKVPAIDEKKLPPQSSKKIW